MRRSWRDRWPRRGPTIERTQRAAVLRRRWDRRASDWHHHVFASPAFAAIRDALLECADPGPGDRAVDLGSGTGFITLPLAAAVAEVTAVDISQVMVDRLAAVAAREGAGNIRFVVGDLATLVLPERSADLIVSNYVMHHLTDDAKQAVVAAARRWCRPGGRLVIADMMFGRGGSARDRQIIRAKVAGLVAKGPGGLWRVVKNAVRFGLRVGTEMPSSPEFWTDALSAAGFVDVGYRPLVQEAGLVFGRAPADPSPAEEEHDQRPGHGERPPHGEAGSFRAGG